MNYKLKKPCKECPYLKHMKGWIGSHKSAMEFHDAVNHEVKFACHKTHGGKEQHCAGYALYARAICKVPKDQQQARWINTVVPNKLNKELLDSFDGSVLVEFHGK